MLLGLLVTVLLVPAMALTVARLGQIPGGTWVRLVAFTPYALPLYVVALLLLAIGWAAGEGAWQRVAVTLTVVAVGGAVLHGALVAGAFLGGAVAPDRGEPIRLMTVNLMLGQPLKQRCQTCCKTMLRIGHGLSPSWKSCHRPLTMSAQYSITT